MGILDDKLHVDEQEMDFLILEELACSPPFGQWFLKQTGHTSAGTIQLLRLARSVSTYDGETDLLVVHATATGESRALLIENKVGASFTQFQPERYRTRGQAGKAAGCWQDFATVLMAPQKYLDAAGKLPFDFQVPYEEVRQTIALHGDPSRVSFKLKLLDLAIAKAKTPYVQTICEEVTAFCRAFREFGLPKVPDAQWQAENEPRAPTSTWILFRIPPFSARVWIEMKPAAGVIDLRLKGVSEWSLRTAFPYLPDGANTAPAGKSSAIRMRAPRMDPHASFSGQEERAEDHLLAVRTLVLFARQEAKTIFKLLGLPETLAHVDATGHRDSGPPSRR